MTFPKNFSPSLCVSVSLRETILMSKIIIIAPKELTASPVTNKMVAALRSGIAAHSSAPLEVQVVNANDANKLVPVENLTYCPLTLQLPNELDFPSLPIYQACQDIQALRTWVQTNFGFKTNPGNLWLPVVLTLKGSLYGEVIGEGKMANSYQQPVDLPDNQRQTIYHLAYELLTYLSAPPAVYLLQFSLRHDEIVFDRFWPFPAAPAIASIGVQQPDLFTCHWCCLTGQPIFDLII